MKRSGFKRRSTPLAKKSTTGLLGTNKRKVKTPRNKAEKALWELCKKIIRKRYQNSDGTWTCYTTGRTIAEIAKVHTGHGKPKGALQLRYKYDLRNLRPQTYNANINLGGMTDIFLAKLEREEEGLAFLNEACVKIDGRWEIKHYEPMGSAQALDFIYGKIEEYTTLLHSL